MSVELDVYAGPLAADAVNVPVTSADTTPFNGSGTLMGWSLREASGDTPQSVNGSVVAPAAGATIVTTAPLGAGTYTVSWTVELAGAAAAADANNFEILNGAAVVMVSENAGAAGQYQQVQVRLQVAQNSTISVKAVGAGTAGVTYTADVSVAPDELLGFTAELQAGNQNLGEAAADLQEADTRWFGPGGVKIEQFVRIHIVAGTLTGCLYVIPDY